MNNINIVLAILYRLVGFKVYFLTAFKFWQSKILLEQLERLGICWLSYHKIMLPNCESYLTKANELRESISLSLSQSNCFHLLKGQIDLQDSNNKALSAVLIRNFDNKIILLAQLLMFAKYVEKERGARIMLWIPNDFITKIALEKEGSWKNLCPKWWTSFGLISDIIIRVLKSLVSLIYSVIKKLSMVQPIHNELNDDTVDHKWSNYEIVYFPHKGIHYGEMFLKDHFYSTNKQNPFHPTKILHFSLGENQNFIKGSLQYYNEHQIPHAKWTDVLSVAKKDVPIMELQFIRKCLIHFWKEIDFSLLLILSKIYSQINNHLVRLNQLSNLKIVLIGYDILFPASLALTCKMKNIRTVAVQERMISAWWSRPFLIDHYFVYGPETSKILEKRFKDLIIKKYEMGPVRLYKHYESSDRKKVLKKMLPDFKWNVLALDVHSTPEWYDNGRSAGNNWRENFNFYQHILKLCAHFPQVYFMIKGKNVDFLNIPYFYKIVDSIEQTPNCVVIKDYELWTPFTSTAVCDITIAMHTSLGDEILALGKPVIFYDYFGFPSKVLDYGPEVIAYTYDDLKRKLKEYFLDPKRYNNKLNPVRKKFYTVPDIPVKQLLNKKLEEIYRS